MIEKVKVDTEIRKLDQLRAVHQSQQYKITWQLRELPARIAAAQRAADAITADIDTRNTNMASEFTMTVGNTTFAGKGARDEAAAALNAVIISWKNDTTTQVRATLRGFRILSRGTQFQDGTPDLYVEGARRYAANLNPSNHIGTMQSIEHTLRSLDQIAADDRRELASLIQNQEDYRAQAGKSFEHEARLTELLARQAELNAALDLAKSDQQAAAVAPAEDAAA